MTRHGEEKKPENRTDEWWDGPDCWPVWSTYYDDLYGREVSKDGKRLMGHGEAIGLKKHHLFHPYRLNTGGLRIHPYHDDLLCSNCGKSYRHIRKAKASARKETAS